jgi:glutamine amidotransferase
MCQLLGMSCNVPTDACFSFSGFSARGGGTDVHADGWGIAFFEGRGCRLFHDAEPARTSVIAELVRRHPIRSTAVVAHIRKATQGRVALENCHPFRRELWGRYWAFAHNGNLEGLHSPLAPLFRPVGDTDSESAFCAMLEAMHQRHPGSAPPLPGLVSLLAGLTAELRQLGPFNYLLSDGEHLFAHCATRLSYLVRQAPFGPAQLIDEDLSVDFQACTGPDDRVAVIATHPLTRNEAWTELTPGQLVVFRGGELVAAIPGEPASQASGGTAGAGGG